jgi:hypothetical protein
MSTIKKYRSEDGNHVFAFRFVEECDRLDIYCLSHPSLHGRDPHPLKTHLYRSGRLCFVEGREPDSMERAEELAKQWAEYFLEYARTGVTQG